MWIICAGGKRSGSTLQYNLVSKIVEESKKGKRISYFKPNEFKKINKKHVEYEAYKVIKVHTLTPEINQEIENNNAIVFHCYRDVRDVVVSSIHKGWISNKRNDIINSVNNYLKEYNSWMAWRGKIHSRKYEDFAFNLFEEIEYILKVLNIDLNKQKIDSICNELSIDVLKSKQNKIENKKERTSSNQTFHVETLIHTNHINDGSPNQFLKRLSKKNIAFIESIAYDYLLKNGYKLYWQNFDKFISFSQHGDDFIAWQLLKKNREGLVVEVGAFDGRHLSNSYSFSQIGWKSVCIEPSPEIYTYLINNRPDAININKAIVGNDFIKEIDFFSEEIGVLSGCKYDEADIKQRYQNRGLEYSEPKKIRVKAATLSSILSELELENNIIDLISIDVEGFELEVLKGLDINNYKVNLFIIEGNNYKAKVEILNFFKDYPNYKHIGDNGQNMFILNKNCLSKKTLRHLDFVDYIKAKQLHPKGDLLTIDSTLPRFVKTNEVLKYEKYFGIF